VIGWSRAPIHRQSHPGPAPLRSKLVAVTSQLLPLSFCRCRCAKCPLHVLFSDFVLGSLWIIHAETTQVSMLCRVALSNLLSFASPRSPLRISKYIKNAADATPLNWKTFQISPVISAQFLIFENPRKQTYGLSSSRCSSMKFINIQYIRRAVATSRNVVFVVPRLIF
jgi:hypothetical protein